MLILNSLIENTELRFCNFRLNVIKINRRKLSSNQKVNL